VFTARTLKYAGNVNERRWRPADLARLAGITEQQVRNYLAAGLLPPAERAANNYRVLTDHHAEPFAPFALSLPATAGPVPARS
jgi:hypothetical protein